MTDRIYEAYEDNAGTLYICALADGRPVWGQMYYLDRDHWGHTGEDYAGMDWAGLVVQGCDPVAEGWEGVDPGELWEVCDYSDGRQIADSSACADHPLGVMLDRCGEVGRLFAVASGAAYRCPECGETLPTVRDVHHPDTWVTPHACKCCGAPLD